MANFKLFLAGSVDPTTDAYIMERDYPRLLSYGYQRTDIDRYCKAKENGSYKGMVMVDSGAFSVFNSGKTINIDDYCKYINENPMVDRFVELDFIPGVVSGKISAEMSMRGAEESRKNYLYMLTKVKRTEKIMPVFHYAEPWEYLKAMVETKHDGVHFVPSICVSGPKTSGKQKEFFDFLAKCFNIINESENKGVQVHALGVGVVDVLNSQPLYSADFASWVMSASVGTIMTKEYGALSVSDRGDAKSVEHMPPQAKEALRAYVAKFGFTYEELVSDYKARWRFNATQCQLIADAITHKPKVHSLSLF